MLKKPSADQGPSNPNPDRLRALEIIQAIYYRGDKTLPELQQEIRDIAGAYDAMALSVIVGTLAEIGADLMILTHVSPEDFRQYLIDRELELMTKTENGG